MICTIFFSAGTHHFTIFLSHSACFWEDLLIFYDDSQRTLGHTEQEKVRHGKCIAFFFLRGSPNPFQNMCKFSKQTFILFKFYNTSWECRIYVAQAVFAYLFGHKLEDAGCKVSLPPREEVCEPSPIVERFECEGVVPLLDIFWCSQVLPCDHVVKCLPCLSAGWGNICVKQNPKLRCKLV